MAIAWENEALRRVQSEYVNGFGFEELFLASDGLTAGEWEAW
jgi:hypothetical protein